MKKTDSNPPQTQYATPDSSTGTRTGTGTGAAYDTEYDYPPYEVHFSGTAVGKTITVTGPHTFGLIQPNGCKLTVSLSRNPATDGKPNLNITFSSQP